jgi:hypothetical protein
MSKHPDLPDVPLITEFARQDDQRAVLRLVLARQALGRPFLGPPGIPPDRLAALRQAFNSTMEDPELLADARKSGIEIRALSGEEVKGLIQQIYAETSPSVAKQAAALLR